MGIRRRRRHHQRGFTLVLLATIFTVVLLGVFVSVISVKSAQLLADEKTASALASAREALTAYAATHPTLPGRLPCPDNNGDGVADCGPAGLNAIGRLPWKTLGIPDLRDASGECLWYAVSANFREDAAGPVNSDSTGNFEIRDDPALADPGTTKYIAGPAAQTRAIAIVFAPGPVLDTHDRVPGGSVCGTYNIAADFLDTKYGINNAAPATVGVATFVGGKAEDSTPGFNDRLVYLTPAQFFPPVERRVAGEIKKTLLVYYSLNGYYPYANDLSDATLNCTSSNPRRGRVPLSISSGCSSLAEWPTALPAWFTSQQWNLLTYYAVASACTAATPTAPTSPPTCGGTGYLTLQGSATPTNNQVVVIEPGAALFGQTSPCTAIVNCLEGINADNLDDNFEIQTSSPSFNDVVVVITP
jgi:type II secretory pathway pseudopilin PulG